MHLMKNIEQIKQTFIEPSTEGLPDARRYSIFGKIFRLEPRSSVHRIILHEDYPLLTGSDVDEFIRYASSREKIVISGCTSRVHPYRLMQIAPDGYERYCMDIPQSIRGNRHRYPNVYSFVPALISIPPERTFPGTRRAEDLELYIVPPEKLLDSRRMLDRLMIPSLRG